MEGVSGNFFKFRMRRKQKLLADSLPESRNGITWKLCESIMRRIIICRSEGFC